jgi:cytoskeleton protein RodZ
MDSRVGPILREARKRRKLSIAEVEAATKIRARYLRAIEDEEWDVLPGGVYTRGFIRTYAALLSLDGERLAADYRAGVEKGLAGPSETPAEPSRAGSAPSGPARSGGERGPLGWLAVAAVVGIAAIAIVVLPGGDGDGTLTKPSRQGVAKNDGGQSEASRQPAPAGVSVRLAASAEVWVCVLDASGQHLVNGQILEAGAEEGPFRSGSFTVSFGNGEVSMLIDGKEAKIPATSSPVGYSIDAGGALTELGEAERPTCT